MNIKALLIVTTMLLIAGCASTDYYSDAHDGMLREMGYDVPEGETVIIMGR